jgi:hypothetical protein
MIPFHLVKEIHLRSMLFPKEIQAAIEATREAGEEGGDELKAHHARRGPLAERRGM